MFSLFKLKVLDATLTDIFYIQIEKENRESIEWQCVYTDSMKQNIIIKNLIFFLMLVIVIKVLVISKARPSLSHSLRLFNLFGVCKQSHRRVLFSKIKQTKKQKQEAFKERRHFHVCDL